MKAVYLPGVRQADTSDLDIAVPRDGNIRVPG
jgi:hypothetical protein